MLSRQFSLLSYSLLLCLLGSVTACGNSELFAPDPQLPENPVTVGESSEDNFESNLVSLPEDFPTQIPQYPNAKFFDAQKNTAENQTITWWRSSDSADTIRQFYQKELTAGEWVLEDPMESEPQLGEMILASRQGNLQVRLSLLEEVEGRTEFTLQYQQQQESAATETPEESEEPEGFTVPNTNATSASSNTSEFADLEGVAEPVRQQIVDLATLEVLTQDSNEFTPNKVITRREFARWLVLANNKMYPNRPSFQIRLATLEEQPIFKDVTAEDPDFRVIQGLADAGLIPSAKTKDTTELLFRPDAPLTRSALLLWKVPLDTRKALPAASLETVKETWGFQDTGEIKPKVLSALLADFENGENANTRRIWGYTTLFQPTKSVTRAEAVSALWYFGTQNEGISAPEALLLQEE